MKVEKNINGSQKIVLEINSLPLRGGTYSIKLFSSYKTTQSSDFCDVVEDATSFTVLSSDYWGVGKTIRNELAAVTPSKFIYF